MYESPKYIHLVCEYLAGGELFERIRQKCKYRESDAAKVMQLFLSALSYLEELKVVHRDLKPENIILANRDDDSYIKIADFGLASYIDEKEGKLFLRCGSPGYVAPELLLDQGYTTQADTFSAGVIMFVMLTGRPLFRGDNINAILEKNRNCELDFKCRAWESLSEEAQSLCKGLLEKDPDQRLTAAQALKHPWFQDSTHLEEKVINRQGEFKVRDEQELDSKACNALVMQTPVLAKRKLDGGVLPPNSPFFEPQKLQGNMLNTPLMMKNGKPDPNAIEKVSVGGIQMNKPIRLPPSLGPGDEKAKRFGLKQIPQLRKAQAEKAKAEGAKPP